MTDPKSEKDKWQSWAAKRLHIQRESWMRAAEKALRGDMTELRNRVDLHNADPEILILSVEVIARGTP